MEWVARHNSLSKGDQNDNRGNSSTSSIIPKRSPGISGLYGSFDHPIDIGESNKGIKKKAYDENISYIVSWYDISPALQ